MGDARIGGRFDQAEALYEEALVRYRGRASVGGVELANALRPLALLWSRTGRESEALPLWREAGRLYESAGVAAGAEECEAWIGRLGD